MFSNFDAEYRKRNELILNMFGDTLNYDFNRETGIMTYFDGATEMYKQAPLYQLPDGIIEFCATIKTINKLYACQLTINIGELSCMLSNEHGDLNLNYLDWIEFAFTEKGIFHVNCNPESPYYEHVLMDFIDGIAVVGTCYITHKNIAEFVCNVGKWIVLTDKAPDFDPVEYLERMFPNGYDSGSERDKQFAQMEIQVRSRYNNSTLCDFASYVYYNVLKK